MSAASSEMVAPEPRPNDSTQWQNIAPEGFTDVTNAYFRAYQSWDLAPGDEGPEHLDVTADAVYQLWINGDFVGEGPARGTARRQFYDRYAVAARFRPGRNHLALLVHAANYPIFKYPKRPASCRLRVQSPTGRTLLRTDERWLVQPAPDFRRDVPRLTKQFGYTIWQEMNLQPAGWQQGELPGAWQPAITLPEPPDSVLLPRDIPRLETRQHAPQHIVSAFTVNDAAAVEPDQLARHLAEESHQPAPTPEAWPLTAPAQAAGFGVIVDFGHSVNRGLQLVVDAEAPVVLDVGYGEHLADGRLRTQPPASDYQFADRFTLRPGRQTLETIVERGFRYVQLVVRHQGQAVKLVEAAACDHHYPLAPLADRVEATSEFGALFEVCWRTLRANTTDTFIDCPMRESALWVNDLLVEVPVWLGIGGDPALVARCLRLAVSEAGADDGLLPAVCPQGAKRLTFPATNAYFPLLVFWYFQATQDEAFVQELLPALLKSQETLWSWRDQTYGLIQSPPGMWNFVDWSFPLLDLELSEAVSSSVNWYYVHGLDATARLLEATQAGAQAAAVRQRADQITAALNRFAWDGDRQAYREVLNATSADYTQLASALAIISGRLPAAQERALFTSLVEETLPPPELFMHFPIFLAMQKHGRRDLLEAKLRRYWLPMIAQGFTTVWEAGVHYPGKGADGLAFNHAASMCHGFNTFPLLWMRGKINEPQDFQDVGRFIRQAQALAR